MVCQLSKVSESVTNVPTWIHNLRLFNINVTYSVTAESALKGFSVFESAPCSPLPSKVLPHDSKARRLFVTSGGLKKVQEIKAEPGSPLQEHISAINRCFPEEIVRYTDTLTHTYFVDM